MRRLIVVTALAAAALAGCRRAGSAKLEGHWQGTHAEGVAPDVENAANVFAMGTEIVARGNQIAVSTPAAKGQQATYYVDSEDKSSVVIHTDKDGPSAPETFVFSDDGKLMTWRLGDGRSIQFQKLAN